MEPIYFAIHVYISSPIFAFASNLIFDNCGGNKSERKYIKLSNRPEKSHTNNSKQSLQLPYCKRAFLASGFLLENGKYFVLQEEVDPWVDGGGGCGNGGYLPHHACFVLTRTGGGGRIHFVLQDKVSTVRTMCSVTLGYVHTVTFSHRFLLFGSKLEFPLGNTNVKEQYDQEHQWFSQSLTKETKIIK